MPGHQPLFPPSCKLVPGGLVIDADSDGMRLRPWLISIFVVSTSAQIQLSAYQDDAGDGWLDLLLPRGGMPIRGFRLDRVRACAGDAVSGCAEVAVFGSSGGSAQAAGWLITAGHAFTHGVYSVCLQKPCTVHPPTSAEPPLALLATLSVAFPRLSADTRVCTDGGLLYGEQVGTAFNLSASCVPLGAPRSPWPTEVAAAATTAAAAASSAAAAGPRSPPRGVAFIKTYKTGSSTIGSLLHRYAETHGLDVALNAKARVYTSHARTHARTRTQGARERESERACMHIHGIYSKAVPHDAALERRLQKPGGGREKRARPTDCLYEFHSFKACMCTACAHCVHTACALHVHTACALHVHCVCTLHAHCMLAHCVCTLHAHCMCMCTARASAAPARRAAARGARNRRTASAPPTGPPPPPPSRCN